MKKMLLVLAMLGVSPAHAAGTVDDVLACMRANVPDTMRVQDIQVSTIDRSGVTTQILQGRLYALREATESGDKLVRAMLRVEAPQGFAGAAYLIRQSDDYLRDGMYLWLPSVKRVRRVTGTFADGGLLGTNFSYSDFRQIQNSFDGSTATLEGPDVLDRRDVNIVSFAPAKGEESSFGRVRAWIDQETCVPLKMDVLENGVVHKRLTVDHHAVQKAGGVWYPSVVLAENLKEGTKSTMRVVKVTTGAPVSKGYFDPETFYK